jgi:TPR repeat protein
MELKKENSIKIITMWILPLVVVVVALVFISQYFCKPDEPQRHGNSAYGLTIQELSRLNSPAEKGDCDAAYRIGRHHMYVSLDYVNAEKYFRLAARCENVEAKLSLITLLRGQQNDNEVDSILLSLKEIDKQAWRDATREVARIRTSRSRG